jgi:hypothetical protein
VRNRIIYIFDLKNFKNFYNHLYQLDFEKFLSIILFIHNKLLQLALEAQALALVKRQ